MQILLGIDEAGRGPLAGPVAVGVVQVARGFDVAREFPGVADSKKLSEKKREELFALLLAREAAGDVQFQVALQSAGAIDTEGIAVVIRRAIAEVLQALAPDTALAEVFLDGALRAPSAYAQHTIIGGDASVPLISLASIAAKVTRDRYMCRAAAEFPEYGFEKHKGYGTKAHYDALRMYGLSPLHRTTFVHLDQS
jgi:ribonuclease HII